MIRTFLNVSVATALLASSFSAAAAPYSFASDYQAPAGATATINFQVPLGAVPQKARKATYGLTLGRLRYCRELRGPRRFTGARPAPASPRGISLTALEQTSTQRALSQSSMERHICKKEIGADRSAKQKSGSADLFLPI